MDKLNEFFKNNDIRIGEGKDFTTIPPLYYSSLSEAFFAYFITFRDNKNRFHFVLDMPLTREIFAINFTGSNDNIIFSILGFHRFFELLLKDILRRINPYLAVRFLEKEDELFDFIDNKLNADEIKTIEYSETIKRFKYAFKHYDKTSEIYIQYLKPLEFLNTLDSLETLAKLSEWRNRIMHNGTALPNLLAFEYLVSQRLIPIIDKVIKSEKKYLEDYIPHFFVTNTGIKIIDEILSIKFSFSDFENKKKQSDLAYSLIKLGHLKELGRCSFNQDLLIRRNISHYEPYYENPIARAEKFAKTEIQHINFFSLKNCTCCGVESLVVYKKNIDDVDTQGAFISWFKCYNCDYSLNNNVGDPNLFGLSSIVLFPKM